MLTTYPTDTDCDALIREHIGTSREGAAFLARIERTKAGLRESAPLQHFVIRFAGIACDYHEFTASLREAIASAASAAEPNPALRSALRVERIEVQS